MLIIVLGTAIEGEARNMIATGRTFSTEAECFME